MEHTNFLSRPHCFGKSPLVSTMQALFEGRKELFTGLAIYDNWGWDTPYPLPDLSAKLAEIEMFWLEPTPDRGWRNSLPLSTAHLW